MAYKLTDTDTITKALIGIRHTGNVVYPNWSNYIGKNYKKRNKEETIWRANLLAMNIYADIVYWYSPTIERNESTNEVTYLKKYKADILQKSYSAYMKMFGQSIKTVKEAILLLEELGLIKKDIRNIGKNKSRIYLELIVDKYLEITFPDTSGVLIRTVDGSLIRTPTYITSTDIKDIGSASLSQNSQPDNNQEKSQDALALKEEKKSDESGGAAAGLDGYVKATSKHPAIQAWRQVTNRYPVKGIWGMVAHKLGTNPDVNVLARVCTQWAAHGFNVMNVTGQLDWYCEAMQAPDPEQWEKGRRENGSKSNGVTPLVDRINKAIEEKGYTWKPDFQEPEIQALLKKYEWRDICQYWDDKEIAARLQEFKPQSVVGRILNGQSTAAEHRS